MGNSKDAEHWLKKASNRAKTMNTYLWDEESGFFFDYDWRHDEKSNIYSLAGFLPLFVGMVSNDQAKKIVNNLEKFETQHGLATTPPEFGDYQTKQWASPNGWAPLHYFVVEGLTRYGFDEDAQRVALKWLQTCLFWYQKTGRFYEKYNVVKRVNEVADGVYPAQVGFGWTNGVFQAFARDYT